MVSSPNISLAVVKEKAPTETAKLFVDTTPKHTKLHFRCSNLQFSFSEFREKLSKKPEKP